MTGPILERQLLALTKGEQIAIRALHPETEGHIALCADTRLMIEDSIEAVLSRWGDVDSIAARVNIALLIRLGQDLRAASLLSGVGYSTQVLSIVAGTYEVVFTIAFIGNDERRAVAWRDHDDPTRPFRSTRSLVKAVIDEQATPVKASEHYRLYRQLCMGKHGNPLFTMSHSFQQRNGEKLVCIGPSAEVATVRALQFALEQAAGLGGLAIRTFLLSFGAGVGQELGERLNKLDERWRKLHDRAVARWGTEDPFPGKW